MVCLQGSVYYIYIYLLKLFINLTFYQMAAAMIDQQRDVQRMILVAKRKREAVKKLTNEANFLAKQADEHESKAKRIREELSWMPAEKLASETRMESVVRRISATTTFNQFRLTIEKICRDFYDDMDYFRLNNYILLAATSIKFKPGSAGYPLCRFYSMYN